MGKYNVSFTSRDLQDLDDIYAYISQTLLVPETALSLVDKIEMEILSLEDMPYRFPERKTGAYVSGIWVISIKNQYRMPIKRAKAKGKCYNSLFLAV